MEDGKRVFFPIQICKKRRNIRSYLKIMAMNDFDIKDQYLI